MTTKMIDYLRRRTASVEEMDAADLIEQQAAQIEMMREALKFLSYMAQTTGNVMGKDAGLMDGIKAAEQALATPEQSLAAYRNKVIEQMIACYSPDDSAHDYFDKLNALKDQK